MKWIEIGGGSWRVRESVTAVVGLCVWVRPRKRVFLEREREKMRESACKATDA